MLVANRKLRIGNDVDEQDMGDFELDLLLDLGGHLVGRLFPVFHAKGMLPLLLSTRQLQSDIETDRNEVSDNTHNCRVGLQHRSGSPGTSDL